MASAGRVLLISKGAWVSGTSYSPMDFVYYGGNSYVCKSSVSGSTDPASDTTHWQLMASGFDSDLITQSIVNNSAKVPSDAAVYAEMVNLESNFGKRETSNTASQNYSKGDYIVLGGKLYKVTSAISNGGTITPGTNVSLTSMGDQMDGVADRLYNLSYYYNIFPSVTESYSSDHKLVFNGTTLGTAQITGDKAFLIYSYATATTGRFSEYLLVFTGGNMYSNLMSHSTVYPELAVNGSGDVYVKWSETATSSVRVSMFSLH